MRTTVTIDDELLETAKNLTGKGRATLLRQGLEILIRVESARRLAGLGGQIRLQLPRPGGVILVDTSIWIDRLQNEQRNFVALLGSGGA